MPIVRRDSAGDTFVPEMISCHWKLISDAGFEVQVTRLGMGRLKAQVETDRVRVFVIYSNMRGRRWSWNDSAIWVDGKRRPIARDDDQLLKILNNPDMWNMGTDEDTPRSMTYAAKEAHNEIGMDIRPCEPIEIGKPLAVDAESLPRPVRMFLTAAHDTTMVDSKSMDTVAGRLGVKLEDGDGEVDTVLRDKFVWRQGNSWAVTGRLETPEDHNDILMTALYSFDGRIWSQDRLVFHDENGWFETNLDLAALLAKLFGAPREVSGSSEDDPSLTGPARQRRGDAPRGKNDRLAVHRKTVFRV